jgi:hypothetical protein
LSCVDLPGVDEIEWPCNRCGQAERAASPLRAVLDDVAAQAGSLSAR